MMIYQILIERATEGKSAFVDASLPPFECNTSDDAAAEVQRLQAETGHCHAAQLIEERPDEQPAQ